MEFSFKYYKRGIIKYINGDYHKAIKYFDMVVKFSPHYPHIYIYRGHSKLKLGDKDGAIQDWTIAAELTVRKRMN